LRSDIKTLQADNLKLYEKIRYMQSYQDDGPIGGSVAGPSNAAGTSYSRANPARRDDLGKYRSLYEQNMNPFEAFRGREAIRAVQALNPLERGVLTLTQAILGNRRTRLYVFFVCLFRSGHGWFGWSLTLGHLGFLLSTLWLCISSSYSHHTSVLPLVVVIRQPRSRIRVANPHAYEYLNAMPC